MPFFLKIKSILHLFHLACLNLVSSCLADIIDLPDITDITDSLDTPATLAGHDKNNESGIVDNPRPILQIGGQAVMEGLIMRNGRTYALAVRSAQEIQVEKRPWFTLSSSKLLQKQFIRGFPILVETLVNGIKALNRSAQFVDSEESEITSWQLILTLILSLLMSVALFILLPHALSVLMNFLGFSGSLQSISFHIWDGFFKILIFLVYLTGIGFVPEIYRVFQYHGAEHKVISCYESGDVVSAQNAEGYSRLHPRCGTTFMLFVLTIAIILHTAIIPLVLLLFQVQEGFSQHVGILILKIFLIIPISALAYELIRYAARLGDGIIGRFLRSPGLLLQYLSTREPDIEHLEVAVVALKEALHARHNDKDFKTPIYTILE